MLNGKAEYIGFWVIGHYQPTLVQSGNPDYGVFRMFIDSRKRLNDSIEYINGRIKDKFGRSRFQGLITPQNYKFTKKYEPKHSDSNVIKDIQYYDGKLTKSEGIYHHEGEIYLLHDNKKVDLGSFVVEKAIKSRTLEFLMRMDHL